MAPTDQLQHSIPETQRVQVDVVTRAEGPHKWRNRAMALGMAGVAAFGLYELDHLDIIHLPSFPHINLPGFHASGNEHATVGVDPHTYEQGEVMAFDCPGNKVNLSANVQAKIPGNKWLGMADASLNKRFFGDLLPCGQTNVLYQTLQVEYVPDKNGPPKARRVYATFPGVSNEQDRIDFSDWRNCPGIKATDSLATQKRKLRDYEHNVKKLKHPKCDSLIHLNYTRIAPVSDTRLVTFSETAAQMAMEIDADPTGPDSAVKTAMVQNEDELKQDMTALIMAKYDVKREDVIWNPDPIVPADQRLLRRFNAVEPDYRHTFKSFKFKKGAHGRAELDVDANGGGYVHIQLSSVRNSNVDNLNAALRKEAIPTR